MFIEERHHKIMEILKRTERVEVTELCKLFDVSEDTIRRDLRILEEKNKVKRTYGGAILPEKVSVALPMLRRDDLQTYEKNEIAILAASFINDNDTILLDGSTTVSKIIPLLTIRKNLTVITNSVQIAHDIIVLESNFETSIKLYMIGGLVQKNIANTVSIESLMTIKNLSVDKVFLGVCAISPRYGLTTPSLEEAQIKKAMIESAREVYLLADSSKFGVRSLALIDELKPEYTIISDSDFSPDIKNEFKDWISKGLQIITPI
ncbi:MAG: DeoR/GlpR family DNA-binding transcription regulator [Clostridia bacterium]|nr:DeoR/GlpR family DNA-binding transcription regulator [Clostridia bacterium]